MPKQTSSPRYPKLTSFYYWFPVVCLLLIIFDLTTTVCFSALSMKKNAQDTLARAESQISQYIHSVWNLGHAIAAAPATRDSSLSLRQRAQALIPYADGYDLFMLGITDENGFLGSTLQREQITSKVMLNEKGIADLSPRPAFQEMMATGESILTDTYLAGADGKTRIYTIWIPYYEKDEIAGAVAVCIKFAFISHIIESTSLRDTYYFTLLDSQNKISANGDPLLNEKTLTHAYAQSKWASISLGELERKLARKEEGSYWGINNGRLEYVLYTPITGTPWKLLMRTDFFGSFSNAFYSLGIKIAIFIALFLLFSLKRNRDIFARERLYDMMTANINEVLFAYDMDKRRLSYVSSNAERVLGVPEKRFMEDPALLRSYLVGFFDHVPEQAPECGIANSRVIDPRTGEAHPLHVRAYRVFEEGKRWLIAVLTDLTEEEKQKAMLQSALEAAEKANLAKSRFLTNMSHDIRTPMNAIVGMTAIATLHIDDKEKLLECLTKISQSNAHLLGLINDVLDMSKIESGKITIRNAPFSLSDLCRNLITLIQGQAEAKSVSLEAQACRVTHELVVGDTLRLNQAFINIAGNAIKFTEPGGTLRIRVTELPSGRAGYGLYQFRFADNGIGITSEFLPRLFQPFERAESSTVSKTEGAGLGLAITKQLITLMQGEISVESAAGKGSCFTVAIPFKLQEQEEAAQELLEWKGRRVLIADADRESCECIYETLETLGVSPHWVLSGEEAVAAVKAARAENRPYHALIVEKRVLWKEGMESARRLTEALEPGVPVIMISAWDWSEIEKEAKQAGVTAFATKPLFRSGMCLLLEKARACAEPPAQNQGQEWPEFSAYRILLVEDNELNMEIAQEILSLTGAAIETAWNGREAVEKISASPPNYYDLVITDIQMPIMNGYEAAAAIRKLKRPDAESVPIIAMTADVFSEDVERAKASGMNDHIAKPIDIGELIATVRKYFS